MIKEQRQKLINYQIEELSLEAKETRTSKIKLVKALVTSEIHSNNLLRLFDLYFLKMLRPVDIAEKLNVAIREVESQLKRLTELLKGIDGLRGLLTSSVYPIDNISSKRTGRKSDYVLVTLKPRNGREVKIRATRMP